MHIKFEHNKFAIVPEMTFAELQAHLPIAAATVKADLGEVERTTFVVEDGLLLAKATLSGKGYLYSFNPETRRWVEGRYTETGKVRLQHTHFGDMFVFACPACMAEKEARNT